MNETKLPLFLLAVFAVAVLFLFIAARLWKQRRGGSRRSKEWDEAIRTFRAAHSAWMRWKEENPYATDDDPRAQELLADVYFSGTLLRTFDKDAVPLCRMENVLERIDG